MLNAIEHVGVIAAAIVAVMTFAAFLARFVIRTYKVVDEHQDAFDYLRRQMNANGLAHEVGTKDLNMRDVLDLLVKQSGVLLESRERLEANQRKQGINQIEQDKKLDEMARRFDDHIIEASTAIRRLDEHITNHPQDPGGPIV